MSLQLTGAQRASLYVCVVSLAVVSAACTQPGGPVTGAADSHCGDKVVTINQASCTEEHMHSHEPDAGLTAEYGDTRFNAEADDDDCKYHVKWAATPVTENADITFTTTITTKADGKGVTGAAPDLEVFLSDSHPAPNSATKTTEVGSGKYTIGPVRFDAAGQWTVRFHIHDDCHDSEDSPHGHVAFFVSVP